MPFVTILIFAYYYKNKLVSSEAIEMDLPLAEAREKSKLIIREIFNGEIKKDGLDEIVGLISFQEQMEKISFAFEKKDDRIVIINIKSELVKYNLLKYIPNHGDSIVQIISFLLTPAEKWDNPFYKAKLKR